MMKTRLAALSVALAAVAAPAFAHHSGAMFEPVKEVTLKGVIKEFQWTNPHAWIQINVPDASGKLVEWSIECASPNTMSRGGWKKGTLKPGDQVTIVTHPMKDGTSAGSLVSVTLADGSTLGFAGPAPAPKPQ
jgi:uncharacterized protein DUF6152